MKELLEKYIKWHGNTPEEWKVAVIEKVKKDNVMYIDPHMDINWVYEDCIDYLTEKSPRRILNLFKKMGYKKMPCNHCAMILKYWNYNKDYKWSPDHAHLFPKE